MKSTRQEVEERLARITAAYLSGYRPDLNEGFRTLIAFWSDILKRYPDDEERSPDLGAQGDD